MMNGKSYIYADDKLQTEIINLEKEKEKAYKFRKNWGVKWNKKNQIREMGRKQMLLSNRSGRLRRNAENRKL